MVGSFLLGADGMLPPCRQPQVKGGSFVNAHVANIRSFLDERGLDAVLIKSKTMKRYLGTVTGSGCKVVITRERGFLIMDGRYVNEAAGLERDLEFRVHEQGAGYLGELDAALRASGCGKLGVEEAEISISEYADLQSLGLDLTLLGDEMALMRLVKDEEEIAAVQHAVDVADDVYAKVLEHLKVGMTEFEISALIHYYSIAAGAEAMSFDTIVATGERSALPHGRPTARRIQAHEPILIDFGVQINGYQSDMTRVCFLGAPSDEMAHVYETVLAAHLAGIDAIRCGTVARDVDAAARVVIERAGFGEYFNHGLGHGIGMGGDYPLLNKSGSIVLDNGMIMSCEPGIYLPGVGGIRIEDDVLLRDGVSHPLNRTDKQLRVLEVR